MLACITCINAVYNTDMCQNALLVEQVQMLANYLPAGCAAEYMSEPTVYNLGGRSRGLTSIVILHLTKIALNLNRQKSLNVLCF